MVSQLVVGFPAGLSPTSFHLFPTSFHLSPTSFHLSPRLGACSRVSGRLASHFLAFVSHFSPSNLLLGVLNFFLSCVRPLCHCWCPPISTGHVAFLFIVSQVCHCWCPPFSADHIPQICRWWCPPFSAGHVTFLFVCLPDLLLLVSVLLRWPCSISIHLSPRSVIGGVRPFPLAMQYFYSFVSQVCHCWYPPFPLAMQHFYSFVSQACHCWCPSFSAGHVAFI